ncbi:dehydrodolichyl diphosphate synthase complex subunit DHDDS-like [Amblyomma americanum]
MATDEARSFRSLVLDALSDLCRRLTMWLLMLDTVPTHVCMVPDGHRRFSKATGTDLRQAYAIGKRNVHLVSDWFFSVSALVVTVFVYSLRNFSRDQFEMRAALDKAKEGYEDILDNLLIKMRTNILIESAGCSKHKFRVTGVRIENVGCLELLPRDVSAIMAQTETATFNNTKKSIKMCAAYSSKDQMSQMVLRLAKAVKEGVLHPEDITTELLEDCINLAECSDAELLLRTGGDQRFSDFLVLQCSYAYYHLEPIKFPELGFRHWVSAMLQFQLRWPHIQMVKERHAQLNGTANRRLNAQQVTRQQTFLRRLQAARAPYLERLAGAQKAALCH